MLYRRIGTTEIKASVVGLGTFPLGGWMWGGVDRTSAVATIRSAWDAGINLVDTAPLYGYGLAEELVGEALQGYKREAVVLSTNCGLRFDRNDWPEGVGEHHFYYNENGLSSNPKDRVCRRHLKADSIIQELEASLTRLRTDYIDIYFTHAQEGTTPIEETASALERLKKQGKIRAIGCSNVTHDELCRYLASCDLSVDQERFNLADQLAITLGLTETCVKNKVSFFSYSPLENGLLTGTLSPDATFPEGDLRRESPRFTPENIIQANALLERFTPLAEKYNITLSQLVIAWTFSCIPTGHVLCGMRNQRHVQLNAEAGNILLSPEEIAFISEQMKNCSLAENEIDRELSASN